MRWKCFTMICNLRQVICETELSALYQRAFWFMHRVHQLAHLTRLFLHCCVLMFFFTHTKYIRDTVSICPPLPDMFPGRNSCFGFFSYLISSRWKVEGYHWPPWIRSDRMNLKLTCYWALGRNGANSCPHAGLSVQGYGSCHCLTPCGFVTIPPKLSLQTH